MRIAALLVAVFLTSEARALSIIAAEDETPRKPDSFACEIIREYIAIYGARAAEDWAKKNRWSKARIAESKKCLIR